MDRLKVLFSLVDSGEVFADIGCDHGYLSKFVLEKDKYKTVIISDISAKSLEKAVSLLKPYGERVISVVADGFNGYPLTPNQAVIAGMGGEEIVKILLQAKTLPFSLILAPQKNSDKVRRTLISLGYKIINDFTFYSQNKFYDAIKAEKGEDRYSEYEFLFGRDNLKDKPEGFIKKLEKDSLLLYNILNSSTASESAKTLASEKLEKIKEIIK